MTILVTILVTDLVTALYTVLDYSSDCFRDCFSDQAKANTNNLVLNSDILRMSGDNNLFKSVVSIDKDSACCVLFQ